MIMIIDSFTYLSVLDSEIRDMRSTQYNAQTKDHANVLLVLLSLVAAWTIRLQTIQ